MNANRNHAHTPTRLTHADFALQAAAVRIGERKRAAIASRERLARLAYCGLCAIAPLVLFYSAF